MRGEQEVGVENLERDIILYGKFESAPASPFSTKRRTLGRVASSVQDEEAKASLATQHILPEASTVDSGT